MRSLVCGITAGAVGTTVLNTVTYLDMVVRGRPASSVPSDTAGRLGDLVGVSFGHGNGSEGASDDDGTNEADGSSGGDDTAANRKEAVGALMGYLTGYGVGAVYGLLRPRVLARVPMPVAGVGIAAAATVSTVAPYSALGVSDPRTWGVSGWLADIIPHLCYGWATAATFDALHGPR